MPGIASTADAIARRFAGGSQLQDHGADRFEAPSYHLSYSAILEPTLEPLDEGRDQLVLAIQEVRQRVRDTETGEVAERMIVRGVPLARVDAFYSYQSPCDLLLDERKILPETVVGNRLPLAYNTGFGRLPRNKLSSDHIGVAPMDGAVGAEDALVTLATALPLAEPFVEIWEQDFCRGVGALPQNKNAPPPPMVPRRRVEEPKTPPPEDSQLFWNCDIENPSIPEPIQVVPDRKRACVNALRHLFMIKPAWTIDKLQDLFCGITIRYRILDATAGVYSPPLDLECPRVSFSVLKGSVYYVAYQFRTGPFRKLWFRRGFDPRKYPLCGLMLQTMDYRISAEDYRLLPEICGKHGSIEGVVRRCPPALAGQVRHVLDDSAKSWVKKQPLVALCDFVHPSITAIVDRRLAELRSMKDTQKEGQKDFAATIFDEKVGFLSNEDCVAIREHAKNAVGNLLGQIELALRGAPLSDAEVSPIIRNCGLVAPPLVQAMEDDGIEFWKVA